MKVRVRVRVRARARARTSIRMVTVSETARAGGVNLGNGGARVTVSETAVKGPCAFISEMMAMADEGERATARHAMSSAWLGLG